MAQEPEEERTQTRSQPPRMAPTRSDTDQQQIGTQDTHLGATEPNGRRGGQTSQSARRSTRNQPIHGPDTTNDPQVRQGNTNQASQPNAAIDTPSRRKSNGKGKNTKAHLLIASLNMRGRGQIGNDRLSKDKWLHISQVMRERKIGVLAIQEAHMTDDMADSLNALFKSRLRILHSQGDNPNAAGVAFVINRDMTNADQATANELVPGRAMSVTVPWHGDLNLTLLNVYAPNQSAANGDFWNDLTNLYSGTGRRRPDVMLGDLNLVEDSLDRIPGRPDNTNATAAL